MAQAVAEIVRFVARYGHAAGEAVDAGAAANETRRCLCRGAISISIVGFCVVVVITAAKRDGGPTAVLISYDKKIFGARRQRVQRRLQREAAVSCEAQQRHLHAEAAGRGGRGGRVRAIRRREKSRKRE